MFNKSLICLATMALGAAAMAQNGVNGALGAEWNGVSHTSVTHSDTAPTSNFGTPGTTTQGASYDIYLRGDDTYLYGLVTITGNAGSSAGPFANLYFDLDPARNNGTDWGMEIGPSGARAFVAGGGPTYYNLGSNVVTSVTATGVEFALRWSYLMDGSNPDISFYSGINEGGPVAPGGKVVLGLSQSFGYSVAGGAANYGVNRLGSAFAPRASAVPGPSALAAFGFGLLGRARRRSKK